MIINLNMFDPFMKDEIWGNMKSNLSVTSKCHLSDLSKLQLFK